MAAGRLKIDIRRKKILELLAQNGQVTVTELSELLNATQTTIRTDLDTMAAENRLMRIPGGAIAVPAQPVQPPVQEAVLLGGEINAIYGFTFGDDAVQQLGRYQPAWAILSVDGVNAAQGITTYHAEEAMVNRVMFQQAHRTIIAADRRKIGRAGFTGICRLDDRFTVITDSGAKPEELDGIRATGAAVEVAEEA